MRQQGVAAPAQTPASVCERCRQPVRDRRDFVFRQEGTARMTVLSLHRGRPGDMERVPLCHECLARLDELVWAYMGGRIAVTLT